MLPESVDEVLALSCSLRISVQIEKALREKDFSSLKGQVDKALLAAPFAFPAKLVVFLPATLIKKERPFSLEVFRHTGHSGHLLFAA